MSKKLKTILTIIFICIQIYLFPIVLFVGGEINTYCSFAIVFNSFIFSLFFLRKDNFLTQIALLFTVIADVFLVLLQPRNQLLAMISFSIAQIFYFIIILIQGNKKINLINYIVRISALVIIEFVAILVLKENLDLLSIVSVFYYINLVLNVVFAFIEYKQAPLLAIGLLLFLLCDTFVGLQCAFDVYIFISHSSLIYKIAFAPFNFVWFFYSPAQTLLSLTTTKK